MKRPVPHRHHGPDEAPSGDPDLLLYRLVAVERLVARGVGLVVADVAIERRRIARLARAPCR